MQGQWVSQVMLPMPGLCGLKMQGQWASPLTMLAVNLCRVEFGQAPFLVHAPSFGGQLWSHASAIRGV